LKKPLLVGWDREDVQSNIESLTRLSAKIPTTILPYTRFLKSDIKGITDFLTVMEISIHEIESVSANDCFTSFDLSTIPADEYEQLQVLLDRTIHASKPSAYKRQFIKSVLGNCERALQKLGGCQVTLIYRNWPHLFTDYALYLAARSSGYKAFVFEPLKGLSNGFRGGEPGISNRNVDWTYGKFIY